MTRARRAAPAFMLVEILLITVLMSVVGLMILVLNDTFYLHRTVAAHANRMATIDGLTKQLRIDSLAAGAYHWDGSILTLLTAASDGRHAVRYTIRRGAIVRTEDGVETHGWQSLRLQFAARLERGSVGDVFFLDYLEQPAPRTRSRAARRLSLPLNLPHGAEGGQP